MKTGAVKTHPPASENMCEHADELFKALQLAFGAMDHACRDLESHGATLPPYYKTAIERVGDVLESVDPGGHASFLVDDSGRLIS